MGERKCLLAMFVTDHSGTNMSCKTTRELTRERSRSSVRNVTRGSPGTTTWKLTWDFIQVREREREGLFLITDISQGRNRTVVPTATVSLSRWRTSGATSGSTPESGPTSASFAPATSQTPTSWRPTCWSTRQSKVRVVDSPRHFSLTDQLPSAAAPTFSSLKEELLFRHTMAAGFPLPQYPPGPGLLGAVSSVSVNSPPDLDTTSHASLSPDSKETTGSADSPGQAENLSDSNSEKRRSRKQKPRKMIFGEQEREENTETEEEGGSSRDRSPRDRHQSASSSYRDDGLPMQQVGPWRWAVSVLTEHNNSYSRSLKTSLSDPRPQPRTRVTSPSELGLPCQILDWKVRISFSFLFHLTEYLQGTQSQRRPTTGLASQLGTGRRGRRDLWQLPILSQLTPLPTRSSGRTILTRTRTRTTEESPLQCPIPQCTTNCSGPRQQYSSVCQVSRSTQNRRLKRSWGQLSYARCMAYMHGKNLLSGALIL